MSNVAILEKALVPLRSNFAAALASCNLSPDRFMQSVLTAYDNSARLRECSMQDVLNAAQTGAFLGVIVDGFTGQAAIVPFRDNRTGRTRAQLIVMYRGYATIADRAGIRLQSEIVREGDKFDYSLGTNPRVDHVPLGREEDKRQLIFAWGAATAPDRTPLVSVMGIDRIRAIRDKSPSARGADSAWKTNFEAMARKSPIRDLSRFLPLTSLTQAAQMEELHDFLGSPVNIHPEHGMTVEGVVQDAPGQPAVMLVNDGPFMVQGAKERLAYPTIEGWRGKMMQMAEQLSPAALKQFTELNASIIEELAERYPQDVAAVRSAFARQQ